MFIGQDNIAWANVAEEIDYFLENRHSIPDEAIRANPAETRNQFNLFDSGLLPDLAQSRFLFLLPQFNPSLGEPPMPSIAVPEKKVTSLASLADGIKNKTGRPFGRLSFIS